jgi:hypothetical protein
MVSSLHNITPRIPENPDEFPTFKKPSPRAENSENKAIEGSVITCKVVRVSGLSVEFDDSQRLHPNYWLVNKRTGQGFYVEGESEGVFRLLYVPPLKAERDIKVGDEFLYFGHIDVGDL